MYLQKLNDAWSAYLEAKGIRESIVITNTTKLPPFAGIYMLEFIYRDKRYHLYHTLGQTEYELRELSEGYDCTTFEAVLGVDEELADAFMEAVNGFMAQRLEGIQTSVDCSDGLELGKERIWRVRLNTHDGSPNK
ncbi:hypothetical protein [Paenibacillus cremeus]|uniref:Uncharacterized protein n=1 Tax=Paenibacillus cremeus TaxID=2163881 RepID=A0A559KAS0_9BACL|nr:hypothetical protein [Paenibacillus cremeus]TVY09227.1 hypothetical protein FPZ49_14915 [Paenibacillus cremeus]